MTSPRETLLCQYQYDPLDRLISHALQDIPERQRFYCNSRLTTEIQGTMRYSIVQQGDQLLAQQRSEGDVPDATLLATDQQRSVLQALKADYPRQSIAYSPYGHHSIESGLLSLLGFNGERPDPVTGAYLLGNGYRGFNPVLMRFNSPDNLSPFGEGGMNAYTYCLGDPINRADPTGHYSQAIAGKLLAWASRAKNRTSNSTARSFTNSNTPARSLTYSTSQKTSSNFSARTATSSYPQPSTLEEIALDTIANFPPTEPSRKHLLQAPKRTIGQIDKRINLIKEAAATSFDTSPSYAPHLKKLRDTGQLARTPEELIALHAKQGRHNMIIEQLWDVTRGADSARDTLSNIRTYNDTMRPIRLHLGIRWRPF